MNVLSFSLYGNNPIYTMGCIKNAELHKIYFKEWEMWVYHNDTVPTNILTKLEELGVKLINTNEVNGFTLTTETESTTNVLKRTRAIAKNSQGVILLTGEYSLTSIKQILIDELVFYIQINDLKAY